MFIRLKKFKELRRKILQHFKVFSSFNHSQVVPMVKNLLEMQETWVQSLYQKAPLGKGMETHSSILAWEIPGKGAWKATVHDITELDTTEQLTHRHRFNITPRQCQ